MLEYDLWTKIGCGWLWVICFDTRRITHGAFGIMKANARNCIIHAAHACVYYMHTCDMWQLTCFCLKTCNISRQILSFDARSKLRWWTWWNHQICYCYPRYTSSFKRSIVSFFPWVFVTWNIWDTSLLYQSICPNSVGRGNVTDTHPAREIRTPHRMYKTRSSLSLLISFVKITWTDIIHWLGVFSTANASFHHHHHHQHC